LKQRVFLFYSPLYEVSRQNYLQTSNHPSLPCRTSFQPDLIKKDSERPNFSNSAARSEKKGIRTRFWGAAVARGCDCAPAAWLPQNMGTAPPFFTQTLFLNLQILNYRRASTNQKITKSKTHKHRV